MVRKLERDRLGRLGKDVQIVELRFTNEDGETEVWHLPAQQMATRLVDDNVLIQPVNILQAYIDDGVDVRLGNQAEIIGRLMRHLRAHHDELGVEQAEQCSYMALQQQPTQTDLEGEASGV